MEDLDSEQALIRAAQRGDSDALASLYRTHYPAIAGHIRRRVPDKNDADDIISDVFVTMLKSLSRYRWMGIPFRIWLFRIATNQLTDWARRKRRWAQHELDTTEMSSNETRDTDSREIVAIVLASLPKRVQDVLSLHYLEEMSISEISKVVRRPEGTVKSQLHEGRKLMRQRLERRGLANG